MIAGPSGPLEAIVEEPQGEDHSGVTQYAVVCHPHPLHGGTMQNKVVHTVARALHDVGFGTIRFNFRGVGASAGSFDDGKGETDDALAVVEWGQSRWPGASLSLAGFSFGAGVAIRASARTTPERLIAVAPAVGRVDFSGITPTCPWLVVIGNADDVVDPQAVIDWSQALEPKTQLVEIAGAGHFFHGRLIELKDAVIAFASQTP